jgi:4-hydroxythreonine-4-phosphate dehydrogenase
MHDFEGSYTVTLGLPIVRTSVDHGTAFDIAWQGRSSPRSMVEAIKAAARLAQ